MEALIVTEQNKLSNVLPQLTGSQLQAVDYQFSGPFELPLESNENLLVDDVIRLIPKRRMVVFGLWKGKHVVAKLFYTKRAAEQMEKDALGVAKMQENKIPTPALYFKGQTQDHAAYILIFERILETHNLEEVWLQKKSIEDIYPILQAVIIEIATQHVLGIQQHDLHLKNFLITEKLIYTLDGAQIELLPEKLSKKSSMDNLALFLSQFGIGMEALQEKLFQHYANARGWLLKPEDLPELFLAIRKWNEQRWARYQKKIMRACTDFMKIDTWHTIGMMNRKALTPALSQLLQHPDTAFTHPTMKMLKNGRSSTVVKVTIDNKDYVVKRYNLKNLWHRLRRSLRATRAMMCWRLAQKLNLFGLHTALPVAFIEKRFFMFRGKSYLITEYIHGQHIGDYFKQHTNDDLMIERVTQLLKNIAKLEITHGDLKMTNILVAENLQPTLIDLDGAAEHLSISSLDKAWRREIKRFLRNFENQPALLKQLRQEL